MTYMGILLPYMLIFAGKTEAVLQKDVVPAAGSVYTSTPSHFANAATTLEYVKKIIIPFIEAQRQARIDSNQTTVEQEKQGWAVLIWDNFSAHCNADVIALLESHRIKPFFLPPNCTSVYQSLDVLFNGVEKMTLKNHFSEWHFRQLEEAIDAELDCYDVLPKIAAKKRTLIAALIRGVHELMSQRIELMLKAWDLTKLFDEDRHVGNLQEIGVSKDVVQAMSELVITIAEEAEVDDAQEIEQFDNSTAPDAQLHENNFDLGDLEDDYLYEEQAAIEEEQEESDDELPPPPPKRPSPAQVAATMSHDGSSSVESNHMVYLTRPRHSAALEVNFGSRFKPSAERIVAELKEKEAIPPNARLKSTYNSRPNGFNLVLGGVSHATVAFNPPFQILRILKFNSTLRNLHLFD